MSKKYKTSEAIAMLEQNPNLKFMDVDGSILSLSRYGYLFRNHPEDKDGVGCNGIDGNIKPNTAWELIQQPVDFLTAVKAYAEGKTIRCERCTTITKYNPNGEYTYDLNDTRTQRAICADEIINGRWYVEE
jgi:hypothetical protein